MKNNIEKGSTRTFSRIVEMHHIAEFEEERVHEVCSTFQVAKDAEWVCRIFVKELKEEGEEGIGTFVSVNHVGPALLGETIKYIATLEYVEKNTVHCSWEAKVGERKVAFGEQTQKIVLKEKLAAIFAQLKK